MQTRRVAVAMRRILRIGRDVEELERELELETGFEVASEKTAQIGYAKLS